MIADQENKQTTPAEGRSAGRGVFDRRAGRLGLLATAVFLVGVTASVVTSAAWLASKASRIEGELAAAMLVVPRVKDDLASNSLERAAGTVQELRSHTSAARRAADDPLWTLAAAIPGLGLNFRAVAEVARSADDVASLGAAPLVDVLASLNWDSVLPSSAGTDLEPLRKAAPKVAAAAHAVRASIERLESIDAKVLLPQVAEPLRRARGQLAAVTGALDASAHSAQLAPNMLGADGPRNYLLIIQNNAESRASGGMPGALAILTLDNGKLKLGEQRSASWVNVMQPTLPVDMEQQHIYSGRLGQYMQDVNLTPDFPTAARTAKAMWERKTGQRVDGVISMDPVVLSYVLDAVGPVRIANPELNALPGARLPIELTSGNVVKTLLSDVYAEIQHPELQDAYFAEVAKEIFAALLGGKGDGKELIKGITRGAEEGRVLLWSESHREQEVIAKYPLSGSIAGPSVAPAQFGVYFNDGTGAKMDYYVKRTVQLVEECTSTEYRQVKVRVTSTNTAPADAATSLPAYVTGAGVFGVPAGTVQTNVVAYGPVQSNMETATVDGRKASFAAHRHSNRPVGSLTMTLAPGQSSTVELAFGKIVQHTEPHLVVTPTVQPVKDVILDTQPPLCAATR